MKRSFDLLLVIVVGLFLLLPMGVLAFAVYITSPGPVIYWSWRFGRDNKQFAMPKFRSMYIDTPVVSTHLLTDAQQWITPVGSFLRRFSLDELPQLWCILRGEMSFVGPRPVLSDQDDLIALRTQFGVQRLQPGLTGWAQVNGRDVLSVAEKVQFDYEYLQRRSLVFDLKILFMTALKVIRQDDIAH